MNDMRDLKQTKLSEEEIYNGCILRMRKDRAQLPDGQLVDREVVEHPGGVAIALEDEKGEFYMVTQWRYAQEQVTLEFPAGKKETGEDPLTTATREIVEETGYEGTDWRYLGSMMPTPAYDTEVIELYYAKAGAFLGQHLDDDEDLSAERYTLDELTALVLNGTLRDAKTMYMTLLLQELKRRKEI